MRDIKLPQVGLELAYLLTTRHKIVCFEVTSRVDIDCARSSLCQAQLIFYALKQMVLFGLNIEDWLRNVSRNCRLHVSGDNLRITVVILLIINSNCWSNFLNVFLGRGRGCGFRFCHVVILQEYIAKKHGILMSLCWCFLYICWIVIETSSYWGTPWRGCFFNYYFLLLLILLLFIIIIIVVIIFIIFIVIITMCLCVYFYIYLFTETYSDHSQIFG